MRASVFGARGPTDGLLPEQTSQSRFREVQVGRGSSDFFGFSLFQVLAQLKV